MLSAGGPADRSSNDDGWPREIRYGQRPVSGWRRDTRRSVPDSERRSRSDRIDFGDAV